MKNLTQITFQKMNERDCANPQKLQTTQPQEIDRLIDHLRKQPQEAFENIGNYIRKFKTDACLCADYLEAMRKYICDFNANPNFDFTAAFGDKS